MDSNSLKGVFNEYHFVNMSNLKELHLSNNSLAFTFLVAHDRIEILQVSSNISQMVEETINFPILTFQMLQYQILSLNGFGLNYKCYNIRYCP